MEPNVTISLSDYNDMAGVVENCSEFLYKVANLISNRDSTTEIISVLMKKSEEIKSKYPVVKKKK